jgi:hypothetical protein
MSTVSGVNNSSLVTYATNLANSASLKRALNKLGSAVDQGDLTSAGSAFKSLIQAHPEYAASSTSTSESSDGINAHFAALSKAIDGKDSSAAQTAWSQIKSDLKKAGVTDLSDSAGSTAKLLAQAKASRDEAIMGALFGSSSSSSLASLLGATASSDSTSATSLLSDWLTYKQGNTGTTSTSSSADNSGSTLDTKA